MTLDKVLELILGNLGVLFLLLLILFGGFKRWWVFGWYAADLVERNKRLEEVIYKAADTAKGGTELAREALATTTKVSSDSHA